ncbi:sodium:proton antiporter [candidate division KSB1 bacterium]
MRRIVLFSLTLFLICILTGTAIAEEGGHGEGFSPPVWMMIPFILMLGSIAIIPLKWEHWWENNVNKLIVALVLGLPIGIAYIFLDLLTLEHTMKEYAAFIIYVGSLFVISGGIMMKGNIKCSVKVNLAFIGIGAGLASFIGTPGASMLLIRPLIRINSNRKNIKHVIIFFIFCVSNIGGCLTPLGDPPLFLGYLKGVPFTWTFSLWPQWLLANLILLFLFVLFDTRAFALDKSKEEEPEEKQPLRLEGLINFLWLAGVIFSVAFVPDFGKREAIMVAMVILSLKTTPKGLRKENRFTFHPIFEVAYLFIGIFLTMIPALTYLGIHGSALAERGLTEPWMFFWLTGILSSFLDNAPTYLTFFTVAQGLEYLDQTVAATKIGAEMLKAISLGAVFMGANTYIGNGPNFMVKAIADESGTKMPSFLGYMLWSGLILIPTFVVITFIVFIWKIV